MKSLLFVMMLMCGNSAAQGNLDAITKAISAGNADQLSQYLDQTVEVAVLEEDDVFSKSEAVALLKQFFSVYKPASFSQVHKGISTNKDSEYCIGNLSTGDATFRVYIYLKIIDNKHLIQELRFDQE